MLDIRVNNKMKVEIFFLFYSEEKKIHNLSDILSFPVFKNTFFWLSVASHLSPLSLSLPLSLSSSVRSLTLSLFISPSQHPFFSFWKIEDR